MGKVVKLEKPGDEQPRARRPARPRRRGSKTALVLGGGGFTGAVYEIGALRAFDLLSVNRTVNQFDIYVGTSAGAFVASMVANGVTPEEMMRVLNKDLPSPLPRPVLGTLLRPNLRGYAERAALLPLRLLGMARRLAPKLGDASLMDVTTELARALPKGLYTGDGVERYVAKVLADPDRSDDFRALERELYLIATDLDTCERVVLGEGEWADVPISKAVAASGALPMVYEPVEVNDRELIDGGIVSTTNLDIAVERGAKFVVVVNPIVPYVNDFKVRIPTLSGSRARRVSDMGFPAIGYQAFKLLAHGRLHQAVKQWEQRYPGVDIVLIEPTSNDELMFGTSIMEYGSRLEIAKHGFESVTASLAADYERTKTIAERHGVQLSASRLNQVMQKVESDEEVESSAWRRVFEQTTGALLRQAGLA